MPMLMALSWFLCRLPLPWALALGRAVACVWYYAIPIRRGTAHANVVRALGPSVSAARRREIVRRSFANICMYAIEQLRAPMLTAHTSATHVRREHIERIDALLARGRGVVAVSCHLGNFELSGASQTVRGYAISAVLKDITWRPAQRFWRRVRRTTRLGQIPPRRAKHIIVEALRQNTTVAFLVDQHMPPHRAVPCLFFGLPAATSPAPVRFALQTGAAILPVYTRRAGPPGHHIVHFGEEFVPESPYTDPVANLRHNTQRLNDILEGYIRAYPEQWLWAHRRWKMAAVSSVRAPEHGVAAAR